MAVVKLRVHLLLVVLIPLVFEVASARKLNAEQGNNPKRHLHMTFNGQMTAICEEIKNALAKDSVLKRWDKFTLGKFSPKRSSDANFETRIVDVLEAQLTQLLAPEGNESTLVLSGSYDFVISDSLDNKDLRIAKLKFEFTDARGVELATFAREVNDIADIAKMAGLTIAFKADSSSTPAAYEERNKKVSTYIDKPSFGIIEGSKTQVTTVDRPFYAVEILKVGDREPLVPTSARGHAFVPTVAGDEIEIALYNYNTKNPVVAKVLIDGIEAVNAFSEDSKEYLGYSLPPMSVTPGKFIVSGWLRTTKTKANSTFKFLVNELGKGSKNPKKPTGKIGVITVEFYEPATATSRGAKGGDLTEIVPGKTIDVEYDVMPFVPAKSPAATVSIRYNQSLN